MKLISLLLYLHHKVNDIFYNKHKYHNIFERMEILDFYKELSTKVEKRKFREEVMERCGIQYPTFQAKVKNDSWSKLEREAVKQIINERNKERYGRE